MKAFKRILLSLLVVTVLFVAFVVVVVQFFGDTLKKSALAQLNKSLVTEVKVKEIDISGFIDFPSISLDLKDIFIEENIVKMGKSDTLLSCEHLYLQFNIFEVLSETYKINDIIIKDGYLNLFIDKDGYTNYNIFREEEQKSEENIFVKLKKVNLVNTTVRFRNDQKKESLYFKSNDFYLKGKFEEESLELDLFGDIQLRDYRLNNLKYALPTICEIDLGLLANLETGSLKIMRGNINLDRVVDLKVEGEITEDSNKTLADLSICTSPFTMSKAYKYFPNSFEKEFKKYALDANTQLNLKFKGDLGNALNGNIKMDFKIKNGLLQFENYHSDFTNLVIEGTYSASSNVEALNLSQISGQLNGEYFQGMLSLDNFKSPKLSLQLKSKLSLKNLQLIFELDQFELFTGTLDINTKLSGKIRNINKLRKRDFLKLQSEGKVDAVNINIKFKDDRLTYENLNAALILHNNDLKVKSLSGRIASNKFEMEGMFKNALAFLALENENLAIEANAHFHTLNLNELLAEESTTTDTVYALSIPQFLSASVNAKIDDLNFRRFNASNLSGIFVIKNKALAGNNISLNTCDGTATGQISIKDKSKHIDVNARLDLKTMDIEKLFTQFENFGQNEITAQHLKGTANISGYFACRLTPELDIISKSVKSTSDVEITNGELNNYRPLIEISDYFREHKLLRLFIKPDQLEEKLTRVKFKKFTNSISIKDETITIPEMNLKTSAMNLDIKGTHTFENVLNYNIAFFLSELMTKGKSDNQKGTAKIYLHIQGPIDDLDISHDKKAFKKHIKMGIDAEKNEIKQILKEELGLFKNDTSVHIPDNKNKTLDYEMIWDEEDTIKTKKDTTQKSKVKSIFSSKDDKDKSDDDLFEDDDY